MYYAKGILNLTRHATANAIVNYRLAVDKSTRGGMEKGIAAVALGDLCFIKEDYLKAQPAYSTAVSIIPKEHKDFERINHLSQVLDNLSTHAESVTLQDSLLRLADMSEAERNKIFSHIIAEIEKKEKEEEEKARREASQQKKGANVAYEGADAAATHTIINNNDKYLTFFTQQVVAVVVNDFQKKW